MKKILLVAASVTLLAAGCQKTEIVNPVGEPAMTFSTGMKKLTKAVGTADADTSGIKNLRAQDFRVWAYSNYDDPNTNTVEQDQIYDGMENLNIYYKEVTTGEENSPVSGSWAPAKEYYWPGTDKNLFFFAVSGALKGEDLATQDTVSIDIDTKTMTVNEFRVDPLNPNVDLMVADAVDQHQGDKGVNLDFHHALSKVEFLFKTVQSEKMRVLVQSIEVEGLVAVGDLTATFDEANKEENKENTQNPELVTGYTWPVVMEWNTQDKATAAFADDYDEEYTEWAFGEEGKESSIIELADQVTKVDPAEPTADFDRTALELTTTATPFATWLMVPQDITDKKVVVTYIINNRQFEQPFSLTTADLTSWGQNQYVRYTVTLAPNLISFIPSVDEWDQYDANGDATDGNQDIEMQN